MNEVFIRVDTFSKSEIEKINKYACKNYTDKDIISVEDLVAIIEELGYECGSLEERIEDLENDIENNYRPISPYEMYGVSERDFY